jgi:putative transposase
LNKGKLAKVVELVLAMRQCASQEAKLQWKQFFERNWSGFESTARQGWTRPWVKNNQLTVSHGQMVMSQVAGILSGFMGNVQNTFVELVSASSLPPAIRHQLYHINRKQAWFWKCGVALTQSFQETNPKTGKPQEVSRKIIIADEVRCLAKALIRKALSLHRKPNFCRLQPQIDQRSCLIQASHSAKHDLWLNLGGRSPGHRVDIPLDTHPGFLARQARINHHALKTEIAAGVEIVDSTNNRNPHPAPFELAKSVRLLLSEDHRSLTVCVATDMRQAFEHSRNAYQVKTPTVSLDMGLCALLATDQGDLLGRDWIRALSNIDKIITGIARHRQSLGLPVRSERYIHHVNRLRGYLKTEINRIFNRLVEIKAPGHIILEALDFSNSQMSRRLNRLIRNFGKGLITQKLVELEKQFGITYELRNPAYTSQQCHGCGYTDTRNRKTQDTFECKFCSKKCHADVNGSRTLRDRRSIASTRRSSRYRVNTTLIEQVRLFNERYPRPRGVPADPRCSNPYFKAWTTWVRSTEEIPPPSSQCALA